MMAEIIIASVIFLITGIILGFFIGKKSVKIPDMDFYVEKSQLEVLKEKNTGLTQQIASKDKEIETLEQEVKNKENKIIDLSAQNSALNANVQNLNRQLSEQKKEIEQLQDKLKTEFENIAQKILKQNAKELKETGTESLKNILEPVSQKFEEFERKITETHQQNIRERAGLMKELEKIQQLNKQLAEDAENLTKALKHDTKQQGNWGEYILERILESSGLEKGEEYLLQYSDKNIHGNTIRPDVIIKLPENKHLIIDSKVSLTAFQEYISAADENEKQSALKRHVDSVRTHIKLLSEKDYTTAGQLNAPDFVLLFTPSEAAFSVALNADPSIYNYAWERKIVIVSPTTLLATLRTVASIWRNEKQIKNAAEIGRVAGSLYDKVVGFLSDMEAIRKNIENALTFHNKAMNKLAEGKGNIIRTSEKLKELGAKTGKQIDKKYLD
ncbi:MAG: DNA recombination protein RmuC [Bacteroidetes bacterium]|nr:MAG: DNA recombination protein RmuC [Bacteroidota bacterium]